MADSLPPEEGWSRLGLLAGTPCGGNLLFIDLETTGLAGGAGSYAFLVGCGWFVEGGFMCGSSCFRVSPPSARCSKR